MGFSAEGLCVLITRRSEPLYCAKRQGHLDVVQLLLRNGADDADFVATATEKLRSAVNSSLLKEVQVNLNLGADVNSRESNGATVLHRASWKGDVE